MDGMIPGINLVAFIEAASIFGVAAIIFAESGLLIGFFLPGDSLLFTMGFLIYTGAIGFNIHLAVLILFVAAALGDSVGYAFGRRAGPRIFKKQDARLFKQEYIQRAQKFYEKRGSITIVLARFIPIVRTFTPIVAGATVDAPDANPLLLLLAGGPVAMAAYRRRRASSTKSQTVH